MPTWIIGDIHGCSDELAELIGKLDLGDDDTLVSVGDLFHRGPNPIGVMDLFREAGGVFILGNHEPARAREVSVGAAEYRLLRSTGVLRGVSRPRAG